MQAIYASKMYKASKNKDKIKAALDNPLNAELVTQLKSYLDPEYQRLEYVDPDSIEPEEPRQEEPDEEIIPSETSGGGGSFSGGSSFDDGGMDHHMSDMLKDEESGSSDEFESTAQEPSEDAGVEEATKVRKTFIKAETDISTIAADQAESIKGLLNSIEDTAGVVRVIVKDDELWIHYNDDTNLNNVMEPVIYQLNASDYGLLQFNRLARTENAIVFSVSPVPKAVEPVEDSNK